MKILAEEPNDPKCRERGLKNENITHFFFFI